MIDAKTTDQPFSEALVELLDEHELSRRMLAYRIPGRGGSPVTISRLCRGELRPTVWIMEAVAQALSLPPSYFAEYRLEQVRRQIDWREHGVRRAMQNLKQLTGE